MSEDSILAVQQPTAGCTHCSVWSCPLCLAGNIWINCLIGINNVDHIKGWETHAVIQPDDVYVLLFYSQHSHSPVNEMLQMYALCSFICRSNSPPCVTVFCCFWPFSQQNFNTLNAKSCAPKCWVEKLIEHRNSCIRLSNAPYVQWILTQKVIVSHQNSGKRTNEEKNGIALCIERGVSFLFLFCINHKAWGLPMSVSQSTSFVQTKIFQKLLDCHEVFVHIWCT